MTRCSDSGLLARTSLRCLLLLVSSSSLARAGTHGLLRLRGGDMQHPRSVLGSIGLMNFAPPFGSSHSVIKRNDVENELTSMKDVVQCSMDIDATADECYRIAAGFDDYPKWAGVKSIHVDSRMPNGLGREVTMKVGMFGYMLNYKLRYVHEQPRHMRWHAISGSVRSLHGSYDFHPISPSRTKVIYKVMVDPGFYIPGPVKRATEKAVARCALNGLKKFTELAETKAMLAASGQKKGWAGPQGSCSSAPHTDSQMDSPRVWMLSTLL